MNKDQWLELLRAVQKGEIDPNEAMLKIQKQPFEDLDFAKIDHHRGARQGYPEVIYGEGKTDAQLHAILAKMSETKISNILITRLNPHAAKTLKANFNFKYYAAARLGVVNYEKTQKGHGSIVVACAGTSDLYAAEEAAITAEIMGNRVTRLYDVGVSGIHRLFAHLDILISARVIIAVAGMEGALVSVIGGLVSCPVIAVPTSVGYGASFEGLAALLSMLNSCASGVSVVNIDNGFGAAMIACRINKMETG